MKKRSRMTKPSFVFTESTQEYRLPNFRYLYETPKSDISLFRELYDNVSVLQSAIDVYATLVNSEYTIETTNESLSDEVRSICDSFKIDEMIGQIVADMMVDGFSGTEIVINNGLSAIEKYVNIPGNEIKLDRDQEGNITRFLQGIAPVATKQGFNVLDTRRLLWVTRYGNIKEPYGRSLFKSLPFLTKIMLEMQDSMGKVYKKYASPRFHVKYVPTVQLDQKTLDARMTQIKSSFANLEIGKDFFTSGDVTVDVVGSGGKELKFNAELGEIMQGVFSGLGLPAGVLGYNYGSTETHLAKQIEILLARITKQQKVLASVINTTLMTLIAKIYGLPEVPIFGFSKSIISDELQEANLETIRIDDTIKLLDKGLITQEEARKRLFLVSNQAQGGRDQND